MTMLKTFDLKGNKLSFADWISNLSPCETPFVSMISKEGVDQTQYSWQTDRLAQPGKQGAEVNPDTTDAAIEGIKEGEAFASNVVHQTKVHTNFTQIFRKAVRVSDTTKKISLYGRNSEFTYQMEKAGMEIKRDLEHAILNSTEKGRLGTEALHGVFDGFQNLVAPVAGACYDTGAVVNKVVNYTVPAVGERTEFFTKAQVFDLTYNLYLAGSRANKIMFHPKHMAQFSDWVGSTLPTASHPEMLHRMFDGLDTKYNAVVKSLRDPLGQVFTLICNRHMPDNMLFFFNESDWSQMVLRAPEKTTLAKLGSSEKQMIEMEVGLRHRNPFASGILSFVENTKQVVEIVGVDPSNVEGDGANISVVKARVIKAGDAVAATDTVVFSGVYEDGTDATTDEISNTPAAPTTDALFNNDLIAKVDVKPLAKNAGKRLRVKAVASTPDVALGEDHATVDVFAARG